MRIGRRIIDKMNTNTKVTYSKPCLSCSLMGGTLFAGLLGAQLLRVTDIWPRYKLSHKVFNIFASLLLGYLSLTQFRQAHMVATTPEEDLPAVRLRRPSYVRQFGDIYKYQQMTPEEKLAYLKEQTNRELREAEQEMRDREEWKRRREAKEQGK